ncbi:MAG: hypothetical protein HDR88_16635 [Bacteroides sp.]|nr:hypothetical protein [Bacteroides sp.]
MRSILLSAFAATVTLTASATTFKEKYHLDQPVDMQKELMSKNIMPLHAPATLSDSELVTDPQGTKSRYAMSVNIFLSNLGATHVGGFGAEVVISDDESTFYSKAFTLNFFQQGYSAGSIEGDKVVFPSGQYIYNTADGEKAYMYAAYLEEGEAWPEIVDTFTLTKDEQGRYISEEGYYFMVLTEEEAEAGINDTSNIICFGFNYVFTPLPADAADNKLPADAEVFECQLVANSLVDAGNQVMKDVTVGVSGDNVYIGGLTDYLPGSYLMGTKTSDNTITFDSHQYIGYYDEGDYPYIYEFTMVNPIYFDGESLYFNEVESINMTFDEEQTMLTIEEGAGIFVCAYADISTWNEVYWDMMIGDFNRPLTPQEVRDLECYGSYGVPYMFFEWSNISMEGIPMSADRLWCEVILNGKPYQFTPEYYAGLTEATDRVYYNTTDVEGLYTGSYTTIYLSEFEDNFDKIKTIGVKVGYESSDGIRYSDLVYANGFEPFEDEAFTPSTPENLVYYKDYYSNIRFKFDGKDVEGNPIPERLLAVEILIDGEPLVFKDSDYYFQGGDGPDVTIIGLSENSINYSYSLINHFGDEYLLSLWGHDELPEFTTLAVRVVCTGADTLTYSDLYEINLERAATPANPWDVVYNRDLQELTFGSMPIDITGNGLEQSNYGYEVYVNDELFTFNAAAYDLESDITLIPYGGFEYNYYFYLYTDYVYDETTWQVIDQQPVMQISMGNQEGIDINKIGVRAVYTDGEGNTTYSDIINSDGTTSINAISNDNAPVKWYNLQGIEVTNPEAGAVYLRQQGGKTTKVYVK